MDLKRLRYFVAVADAGGFTRAAERLNMSQPPLSRRVHELEAELGVKLIDRDARPQVLTEAGRLLLDQARPVLQRIEQIEHSMRALGGAERPSLRVGLPPGAIPPRMPELLRRFRDLWPAARLSLVELTSVEQVQALREGRIDVGFSRVRVDDPNIQRTVLLEEPVLAALSVDHPLAAGPVVALADLVGEPLVLFPNDTRPSFGDAMLSVLHDHGLTPREIIEVRDLHTAMTLVAAREAVSLAPEAVRLFFHPEITFRPLREAVSAPLILSYRPGGGPIVETFIQEAEAALRDVGPIAAPNRQEQA